MTATRRIQYQRGMAIALLLWMLAAMALTVSVVVHFSQGDVSMAQLRLHESRAWWSGRGLALLAAQEYLATNTTSAADTSPPDANGAIPAGEELASSNVIFRQQYPLSDGIADVELYSAVGLLSLNNASQQELAMLFQAVGQLDVDSAATVAEAMVERRSATSVASFDALNNPGFRYVEELLSIPGVNRMVYDRVRHWVHPYATAGFNVSAAPVALANLLGDASPVTGGAAPAQGGADSTPGFGDQRATSSSSVGGEPLAVMLTFNFSGEQYQQMVFVDATGSELLRVGAVYRLPADGGVR